MAEQPIAANNPSEQLLFTITLTAQLELQGSLKSDYFVVYILINSDHISQGKGAAVWSGEDQNLRLPYWPFMHKDSESVPASWYNYTNTNYIVIASANSGLLIHAYKRSCKIEGTDHVIWSSWNQTSLTWKMSGN